MAQHVRSLALEVQGVRDLALIDSDDGVWIVVRARWYDIATWAWYWLTPSDQRAIVKLGCSDGTKLRTRAVRVATRHARVKGWAK